MQKRRVIYVDDDDWNLMRARATARGKTISAYLRAAVTDERYMSHSTRRDVADEASVAAISATRNPSLEFTPAPKPGKRHSVTRP